MRTKTEVLVSAGEVAHVRAQSSFARPVLRVPTWRLLLGEVRDPPKSECSRPELSSSCGCGSSERLVELCKLMEYSARVVDRHLHRPASWRGMTRRSRLGHARLFDEERYSRAFNWAVERPRHINVKLLVELHARVVGWREFRTCHLWVNHGSYRHPSPDEFSGMLEAAFARYADTDWPV